MKKLMVVLLCVMIFATLAMAQNAVYTSGTGITSAVDVLGAHNNYGRGCAGCHAPHSGARGAGGNSAAHAGAITDPLTGTDVLFAQDVSPFFVSNWNAAFGDSGAYQVNPGADGVTNTGATYTQKSEVEDILMCLACHDGNVAKGGMMKGVLWESALLPAGVYGPQQASIPTLLGNDGSSAGQYNNDHPVGRAANFAALSLGTYFPSATTSALGAPNAQYASFAANYGYPALQGSVWSIGLANPDNNTNVSNLYVTCTTCHNQHVMYVYASPVTNGSLIAGNTYPTYFFVNSPYNPGASVSATSGLASSATQFCRQCHFGESNEAMNITSVKTQF
jgi:cytochrome c553